ncbi:MAG: TetR/AcrR family transcriptional regulator [Actinomycetota bacterium]|nr:TetR/AcrR family transcriptional regulator [Actinomycetota bacterium]
MSAATLLERAFVAAAEPPSDATSARILDAARDLVAASGLKALTMDDVAVRAGVGRMTVYRRFGDRDAMIDALAVREVKACLAALDEAVDVDDPVPDQIAAGFVTSLRLIRTHPLLDRFARHEPGSALEALNANDGLLFGLAREFVAARLRESLASGDIRALDPDHTAELLVRLGVSFLLIPRSVLPLADEGRAAEVARRLIAPVLG